MLPPGIARRVDLLRLDEPFSDEVNIPAPVEGVTQTPFELQFSLSPADGRHRARAGPVRNHPRGRSP